MEYSSENNLVSQSGYSMPFKDQGDKVIQIKGYGLQQDGSFHHHCDFSTKSYPLLALADGQVTGLGWSAEDKKMFLTIRYGDYQVTYTGVDDILVQFGAMVKAKKKVAKGGEILHLSVTYKNEEIDPLELLSMLFTNLRNYQMEVDRESKFEYPYLDLQLSSEFDGDAEEIASMMMSHYGNYMGALAAGTYCSPTTLIQSLQNLFRFGYLRKLFYECMPSMLNPLGLGSRATSLIEKAQSILIRDFLNYMAIHEHVFLSSLSEEDKKKDFWRGFDFPE